MPKNCKKYNGSVPLGTYEGEFIKSIKGLEKDLMKGYHSGATLQSLIDLYLPRLAGNARTKEGENLLHLVLAISEWQALPPNIVNRELLTIKVPCNYAGVGATCDQPLSNNVICDHPLTRLEHYVTELRLKGVDPQSPHGRLNGRTNLTAIQMAEIIRDSNSDYEVMGPRNEIINACSKSISIRIVDILKLPLAEVPGYANSRIDPFLDDCSESSAPSHYINTLPYYLIGLTSTGIAPGIVGLCGVAYQTLAANIPEQEVASDMEGILTFKGLSFFAAGVYAAFRLFGKMREYWNFSSKTSLDSSSFFQKNRPLYPSKSNIKSDITETDECTLRSCRVT